MMMDQAQINKQNHHWSFFRAGGFDHVRIETADDLRHLAGFDQKLWSVLACPTSGLELDSRMLQLLDTDSDDRVRATEIISAVQWVCKVLRDVNIMFDPAGELPLDAINTDDEEGAHLLASARQILTYVGKPDVRYISIDDLADQTKLFSPDHFNGDGVVTPELAVSENIAKAIQTIIATLGGKIDRSGHIGVDAEMVQTFFADSRTYSDWLHQSQESPQAVLPLGESTAGAAAAYDAVSAKVEDYFMRCRLASFDDRAIDALNPAPDNYASLATDMLELREERVSALPLAIVNKDLILPLKGGINPAWVERIERFHQLAVLPLLGDRAELSMTDWQAISDSLKPYLSWKAAQPQTPVASVVIDELRAMLSDNIEQQLLSLIGQDNASGTWVEQVESVERLLRYHRNLVTLLRNYVSLADFYSGQKKAIFQAGTLYLDQRSCELCIRVTDTGRHAEMAPLSGTFLVYCECSRSGQASFTIVAAITGGEADEMMVPGRNGIFYDRQERDWHATVTKVITNPISVSEAFWMPYKRIGRMIEQQIEKFAAAREKAVEAKSVEAVEKTQATTASPAQAASVQAFDIAKFAGIFAAIGLALGALGTALAAIVTAFLSLPVWQIPLVIAGIMLLISGPAMLLAWMKLCKRNIGPLLDANGWAVNTRARINIPFGAALTNVAKLPEGAKHLLVDPFAEKRTSWGGWIFLALVVIAVIVAWQYDLIGRLLNQ